MKKSLDMHMVTRTNTEYLTQAEKDKILAPFSDKAHSRENYSNSKGPNSQFMKRGEYLIEIGGLTNYTDGTTGYRLGVTHWDYQENKWVEMVRRMNSATGEGVYVNDYLVSYSNHQSPCREQYYGRCYVGVVD